MARTFGDWFMAAFFALGPVSLGLLVGLEAGHARLGVVGGLVAAAAVTFWALCAGWFERDAAAR